MIIRFKFQAKIKKTEQQLYFNILTFQLSFLSPQKKSGDTNLIEVWEFGGRVEFISDLVLIIIFSTIFSPMALMHPQADLKIKIRVSSPFF